MNGKSRILKCRLMNSGWTLNLFGFFLTRNPESVTERTINHERIHTAQMRELLYIFFYLFYGIEYIVRLALKCNAMAAYRSMSFEQEAYKNDRDMSYLKQRRHYSQWRRN